LFVATFESWRNFPDLVFSNVSELGGSISKQTNKRLFETLGAILSFTLIRGEHL